MLEKKEMAEKNRGRYEMFIEYYVNENRITL